ncbi:hypothetical protein GCM10022227_46600 [Streptomyces sedi]
MQIEGIAGGYQLRLTESQYGLLVNSLSALTEMIDDEMGLEVVLGGSGGDLRNLLERAERAVAGSRLILNVRREEIHGIYALLVSLPEFFLSEETYYWRVGAFRENSKALAVGIVSAVSEIEFRPQ